MIKGIGAVLMVVTTGLAIATAGCQGHQTGWAGVSSPAVAASATAGLYNDALVAYRGMWSAFERAATTADPDNPAVRTYASDDALRLIVSSLVSAHSKGAVIKGTVQLDPTVTEPHRASPPTQVGIVDCVDMRNWLVYKASGGLWNDTPGGFHHVTATVKESGGTWKVSTLVVGNIGTCGPSGAASSSA